MAQTNYALASNGATITASRTEGAGFPASSLIDGILHTNGAWASGGAWSSGAGAADPYVIIQFPTECLIGEIDISTLRDSVNSTGAVNETETFSLYGATGYYTQYWNGSAWMTFDETVVTGNNKVFRRLPIIVPVLSTKLKVVGTASATGDNAIRFCEIRVLSPAFRTTTSSTLPTGTVGVPYNTEILTANGTLPIFSATIVGDLLPPGLSIEAGDRNEAIISGNPTTAGTYTFDVEIVDDDGQALDSTFSITINSPPVVPLIDWSKANVVPRADLEAWNVLDIASSGAEVADYSGKNRVLAAASAAPALQPNVINGYSGIYFSGANNPLKYTGAFTLRHAFLIAAYEDATFPDYKGLFSNLSDLGILVGKPSTNRFDNMSYSIYGKYSYLKNYVTLTEDTQLAPVSNKIAIIEVIFPAGFGMDGIQIGQDRNFTDRKWKGYFIESLMYSQVKDSCDRFDIYQYFAMKFHLWRQTAAGINIFPFANNRKTTGQSFVNSLESTSISGVYKGRRKSGLIRSFDFPFTVRRQEEWDAAETFTYQNKSRCVVEDNSFYPPRQFTGRITTGLERETEEINSVGYKFGFVTTGPSQINYGGASPFVETIDGGTP